MIKAEQTWWTDNGTRIRKWQQFGPVRRTHYIDRLPAATSLTGLHAQTTQQCARQLKNISWSYRVHIHSTDYQSRLCGSMRLLTSCIRRFQTVSLSTRCSRSSRHSSFHFNINSNGPLLFPFSALDSCFCRITLFPLRVKTDRGAHRFAARSRLSLTYTLVSKQIDRLLAAISSKWVLLLSSRTRKSIN